MRPKFLLHSKRLTFRPLELADAAQYALLGVSFRSTGKIDNAVKAKKYFLKSYDSKDSFDVGIFLSDKLIGTIEVCHMSWIGYKGAEICYSIQKKHWSHGYATEACRTVIDYCFSKMKLHKIYADTWPDNIASQRVLEKLGFTLEGRIREKHYSKGKASDELDYGLLRREWK